MRVNDFLTRRVTAVWLSLLLGSQAALAMETVYQQPLDFLQQNLPGCRQQALWLNSDIKTQIQSLIGRPFPGVRVRYCQQDEKTAWILDEIGKTEPITSGIIIDQGRVAHVRVLVFRESRGSEVHRDVFTAQFTGAQLEDSGGLDRHIDGITGATMSVSALTRQAKLALLLDQVSREQPVDR